MAIAKAAANDLSGQLSSFLSRGGVIGAGHRQSPVAGLLVISRAIHAIRTWEHAPDGRVALVQYSHGGGAEIRRDVIGTAPRPEGR